MVRPNNCTTKDKIPIVWWRTIFIFVFVQIINVQRVQRTVLRENFLPETYQLVRVSRENFQVREHRWRTHIWNVYFLWQLEDFFLWFMQGYISPPCRPLRHRNKIIVCIMIIVNHIKPLKIISQKKDKMGEGNWKSFFR